MKERPGLRSTWCEHKVLGGSQCYCLPWDRPIEGAPADQRRQTEPPRNKSVGLSSHNAVTPRPVIGRSGQSQPDVSAPVPGTSSAMSNALPAHWLPRSADTGQRTQVIKTAQHCIQTQMTFMSTLQQASQHASLPCPQSLLNPVTCAILYTHTGRT